MRLACPACERIAPARAFRLEGEELFVRCAHCDHESALLLEGSEGPAPHVPEPPRPVLRVVPIHTGEDVVAKAAQAAQDPFALEPPDGVCPKCLSARAEPAQSCGQCGLVFVNFRRELVAPSEPLADGFRALLSTWSDELAHDRLFALAAAGGELAALGRLYRIRLARSPGDPLAERGVSEVLRRATDSSVLARAPERTKRSPWPIYVLAGAVMLLALLTSAWFFRMMARS